MKKHIYATVIILCLSQQITPAQLSMTQKHEVSDAEQEAFTKIIDTLRNSVLTTEASYKEVAALLKKHPQIVNAQDTEGYTALIWSARYDRTEIAKLLITAGADLNAQNSAGWTALMSATYYGSTEIAKLLIVAGANVNAQNAAGWTALMSAANNGRTEIVKLLIAAGADPDIQNTRNKRARDYAQDKDAYDAAVQEGLRIKDQYEKDQVAAKHIITQEVTHIAPLVDIISGYAYDPHNPDDLLSSTTTETQQAEEKAIKENSENIQVATVTPQKRSWCVVQ